MELTGFNEHAKDTLPSKTQWEELPAIKSVPVSLGNVVFQTWSQMFSRRSVKSSDKSGGKVPPTTPKSKRVERY